MVKKYPVLLFAVILVLVAIILGLVFKTRANSVNPEKYVYNTPSKGSFPLATNGNVTSIIISDLDYPGVLKVANQLQNDIKKVTGKLPAIHKEVTNNIDQVIIIGTINKSPLINQLVAEGKIDKKSLDGKWEKFMIQHVKNPIDGIKNALVIAGSDKRGTIYGMYDLSSQIGISPWYFWADVPILKQTELHVTPGVHTQGEPKVKYRGIFINDEAPALTGWVYETYGGFNAKFYDKVFELILRLKGNYLWPAMWQPRMFYVDDPENAKLANEYGIVMGTSHHEPLTRAHAEWRKFGKGDWNYETNPIELEKFWKDGMIRRGSTESIVTIGMRGDGDEAMSEGTAIELLENIVKKQREIIAETTGKPAEETPQIWALYKEVQDYYDKGMRVPDDVTLLLCDDNWGNIRKLPSLDAKPRQGGYGIYYHFDYVGGPRNYKWINTNQIERVWEQMHLAYKHGVDQLWIVNVGDIKPMEFPIEFFLDYAWNPDAWTSENLNDYYTSWSNDVFGDSQAKAIAEIIKKYTKYNARRKPELLDSSTYSLTNYNEADRIVEEYNSLASKAIEINKKLPEEYQDAYYQLVLFPVLASANLNELYVTAAKNKLYAIQKRASTNSYAKKVKKLFAKDAELTDYYHTKLANGKWNHMMAQTHIGYTYWQQPRNNNIPETTTIELENKSAMGITIDNSDSWWPNLQNIATLPTFDPWNNQTFYFTIFNRGNNPFKYEIKTKASWIQVSEKNGMIGNEETKIGVHVDFSKAPKGSAATQIIVKGADIEIPVKVKIYNPIDSNVKGFVESNGYISIEAEHFSEKYEPQPFQWKIVKNLGKTGSSVISLPIKTGRVELDKNSPRLSYNVYFKNTGNVKVHAYFSPTINYTTREGMYYGMSFDDENPIRVNYDSEPLIFNYNGKVPKNWDDNVADNIKIITSEFEIKKPGMHRLNYYRIDEGLVLQKIVIVTSGTKLPESYLGPPESKYIE